MVFFAVYAGVSYAGRGELAWSAHEPLMFSDEFVASRRQVCNRSSSE